VRRREQVLAVNAGGELLVGGAVRA
jgi:hypothetical protein